MTGKKKAENHVKVKELGYGIRPCSVVTGPFRCPILEYKWPFQNGEKVISTAETVAQRNGTIATEQGLKHSLIKILCPTSKTILIR